MVVAKLINIKWCVELGALIGHLKKSVKDQSRQAVDNEVNICCVGYSLGFSISTSRFIQTCT